ncbi:hypothetical protein B0T22DRAFT_464099 [Podospora appendiculata]|uniref:Uncharacterized protein n=1 Tax=Podospora appendiculata TaxID=314037 RepID=A0AAE0X469_9PEZI|nr:hypothetical protein B0T22DRAFT_464099 [Podospora appendiculata]
MPTRYVGEVVRWVEGVVRMVFFWVINLGKGLVVLLRVINVPWLSLAIIWRAALMVFLSLFQIQSTAFEEFCSKLVYPSKYSS